MARSQVEGRAGEWARTEGISRQTQTRSRTSLLSRLWAWAFLGLMVVFFVVAVPIASNGAVNFLTVRNSQNILVAITPVLLLGLGQTFVIIGAGIDLSVGWVMSLASVLLGAGDPRRVRCRAAALSRGRHRLPRRARRLRRCRAPQWRDHRQAEGAGLHRDPRQLVHRARRRASDVGKHHRDRPAARHPRLRQRGAHLLYPRRGRRALFPRARRR